MLRSTCDSAAKLTIAHGFSSSSKQSTRERSAISPLTKRWRSFTIPDRFSRLPAYVSLSRLTTRQSPLAQRSRTKLLPIKPQPPVTNTVFIQSRLFCLLEHLTAPAFRRIENYCQQPADAASFCPAWKAWDRQRASRFQDPDRSSRFLLRSPARIPPSSCKKRPLVRS